MQRREQTMPRHPDLNRKLLLLYFSGLNTRIDKHNKLARELGIARQNISKWINGSDTHEKDSVPTPQVAPIARLFSIEPAWLRLPFDEFERRVQRRLEGLNLVEQLRVPLVFTNVPCESPFNFVGRDREVGISRCMACRNDESKLLRGGSRFFIAVFAVARIERSNK